MAFSRPVTKISVADYLAGERDAGLRHEYVYGEVFAMAGASVTHNLITGNVSRAFGNAAAAGDCRVYASDMKVRVGDALFYYPDVMIVCALPADDYYETAPCVVVEVASKTTWRNDYLEKRFAYLELESLQFYLLIDSRKRAITGFRRGQNGWEEHVYTSEDEVAIPCIDTTITFEMAYHKTQL